METNLASAWVHLWEMMRSPRGHTDATPPDAYEPASNLNEPMDPADDSFELTEIQSNYRDGITDSGIEEICYVDAREH